MRLFLLYICCGLALSACGEAYSPQRDVKIDASAKLISTALNDVEIADCFVLFQTVEAKSESPNFQVGDLSDGSTELLLDIGRMVWLRAYEFETSELVDEDALMRKSRFSAERTPNGIVAHDIDRSIAEVCFAADDSGEDI